MLEIGSLVDGKYRILRVVGKGGMSVVYQAVNEKANKIWAIKEVRKDGVQNFEVVKQNLIVETELLKRFNHPNLPSIIDVIDGEGSFIIVMDYIEGNSLSKALETSGAQKQEDVIEWSKQLCDVLGYLHSRKPPIIYRDMKPANVMLKPDGNISLIDFGTAREFKSSSVEDTTCLGTQGYAAPEQYGGHGQTDARTDIYCLGATMYHLVTGHNPSTPPYEMYPIRQWNPMLSSGLEEIIIKCTQRNPDDRYQSCAELLYALDHYQDMDIEARKVQNVKWKTFIASIIATLVMVFATVGFSIATSVTTSNTFSALMEEGDRYAQNAEYSESDKAEAEKKYVEAIENYEHDNADAYEKLLNLYMADGSISSAELGSFRKCYDTYKNNIKSKDEGKYDTLMLDTANYLFFCYETKNNTVSDAGISLSKNWYQKVAESSAIDEQQRSFAETQSLIAENYGKVGSAGIGVQDSGMSYKDYFETLNSLVDQNWMGEKNILIAFKMYNFAAYELERHVGEWRANGISEQEYLASLDKIKEKVDTLKPTSDYTVNESKLSGIYESIIETYDSAYKTGYGIQSNSDEEGK